MHVLLVYGVKNWAWHHMAVDLQKHAPDSVRVTICSNEEFEIVVKFAGPHAFGPLDAAFHFSWQSASTLRRVTAPRYGALVTSNGVMYRKFNERDWNTRIWTEDRNARAAASALPPLDVVITPNRVLHEVCSAFNPKTVLCPIGVDGTLFSPDQSPKHDPDKPRLGWCADRSGKYSVKGYEEVLLPLKAKLPSHWKLNVNDRTHKNALTRLMMAGWYRELDAFLCTSINEGSPNTVLEAAASGLPIVSTEVGMVRDWPELRELGLVCPEYANEQMVTRTIEAFRDKLTRLFADTARYEKACSVVRKSVLARFSWEQLAPQWFGAMLGVKFG